ncbi:MAG TPA: hypothetical protein ENH61_01090 [Methylophaga aminisulfidivorans]|nr:hypothetical protein [Methylophaga aminisulfidivorans]
MRPLTLITLVLMIITSSWLPVMAANQCHHFMSVPSSSASEHCDDMMSMTACDSSHHASDQADTCQHHCSLSFNQAVIPTQSSKLIPSRHQLHVPRVNILLADIHIGSLFKPPIPHLSV